MSTFIFAPGIKVYIDSYKHGAPLDVSDDIVGASMQRRSDGVSQFQFGLMNARRKYDNIFTPNDRIVVVMKRLTWMRTFTGYLNQVPIFSSWPRDVQLTASCSLKRLQYFFWDPNLMASQEFVRNSFREAADGGSVDGGSKQAIINILEDVVDWSGAAATSTPALGGSKIHIGAIPKDWFDFAAKVANSVATNVQAEAILAEQLLASMGGNAAYIGGQSVSGGGLVPAGSYPNGKVLTEKQAGFATKVIATALARGMGTDDLARVVACCLVESNFTNYSNYKLGESQLINSDPNEIRGHDIEGGSDSVGLFQQQVTPGLGWGSISQCMDPVYATNAFCERLEKIHDRDSKPFYWAIARVQRPAKKYEGRYGQVEEAARAIVKAYADNLHAPVLSKDPENGPATGPTPKNSVSAQAFVKTAQDLVARLPQIDYLYGSPTRYDDPNPKTHDCSSFVNWVYFNTLGTINDMPRNSALLYDWAVMHGKSISVSEGIATPGALLFASKTNSPSGIHHIEISLGGKRTIGAHKSGTVAGERPAYDNFYNFAALVPSVSYSGSFTEAPVTSSTTGTPGATTSNGVDLSALTEVVKQQETLTGQEIISGDSPGLFGNQAWQNLVNGDDGVAQILTGIRAISNDHPILPYIQNLCNSAMRSFCSAPNGDFMAWFPDYYGIWKTAAKMVLQPIEVLDFTVDWSDEHMVTHQFVAGSWDTGSIQVDLTTAQANTLGAVNRSVARGVATIESPGIMAALFGLDQTAEETSRFTKFIFDRFGPRPDFTSMPNIVAGANGNAEFFMSLYLFMQNWAAQFNANIDITFMPELYPGMILQFPEYNFQAYVNTVSHSVRFGPGGGYSTTVNIMAPARMNNTSKPDPLLGLPIAGAKGNLLNDGGIYQGSTSTPYKKTAAQQAAVNAKLDRLP